MRRSPATNNRSAERAAPRPRLPQPMFELLAFFALTCAFTWGLFFTASNLSMKGVAVALVLLGSFGPSLVAVALTWRLDGGAKARSLLGRLLLWRVQARWYA